jgi:hypothetical protein
MSIRGETGEFTVVYFIYRLLLRLKKISALRKTLNENKRIWWRQLPKLRPVPNSGHKFEPMSVNFRLKKKHGSKSFLFILVVTKKAKNHLALLAL